MITTAADLAGSEAKQREAAAEAQHERWAHWPIHWSGIWAGALASIAAVVLFGLIGLAVGAHLLTPEHRVVDLKKLGFGALAFSVCAAFFAFVIGGWVAAKISGILRSEPAMLHGAIVWLLTLPFLFAFSGMGAAGAMGGWYAGMNTTPAAVPYDRPEALGPNATEAERLQYRTDMTDYQSKVKQWRDETPRATRNAALGSITALLLGLIGSVVGGWMASGEPMNFSHHRTRPAPRSQLLEHL